MREKARDMSTERSMILHSRKQYTQLIRELQNYVGKRVKVTKQRLTSGLYPHQVVATGELIKLDNSFIVIERDDLTDTSVKNSTTKQVVTFMYPEFIIGDYKIELLAK